MALFIISLVQSHCGTTRLERVLKSLDSFFLFIIIIILGERDKRLDLNVRRIFQFDNNYINVKLRNNFFFFVLQKKSQYKIFRSLTFFRLIVFYFRIAIKYLIVYLKVIHILL